MTQITSFSGRYAFLSNFYPSPIVRNGTRFPTVEHAFQALKSWSVDRDYFEKVVAAKSPGVAKRLGRKGPVAANWDAMKNGIMRVYVHEKFVQHPELAEKLLQTGDAILIEGNYWEDTYWGQCPIGHGKNMLGRILMEERAWHWRARSEQGYG